GSLDPSDQVLIQLQFSRLGAGIGALSLAREFETIKKDAHTVIQREHSYTPPPTSGDPNPQPFTITPMADPRIDIEGQEVYLVPAAASGSVPASNVWRQIAPGNFEAIILNKAGDKVARVERKYSVQPGSYLVHITQTLANLTAQPLTMRWVQFGP